MTLLTILRVTEILCSFQLVVEGQTGKETPESSRLDFLIKFSANNIIPNFLNFRLANSHLKYSST